MHRVVCPFTPQLSLVLINRPQRDGTLSWHWYTAAKSRIRTPRPRDRKSDTVPLGHCVPYSLVLARFTWKTQTFIRVRQPHRALEENQSINQSINQSVINIHMDIISCRQYSLSADQTNKNYNCQSSLTSYSTDYLFQRRSCLKFPSWWTDRLIKQQNHKQTHQLTTTVAIELANQYWKTHQTNNVDNIGRTELW